MDISLDTGTNMGKVCQCDNTNSTPKQHLNLFIKS